MFGVLKRRFQNQNFMLESISLTANCILLVDFPVTFFLIDLQVCNEHFKVLSELVDLNGLQLFQVLLNNMIWWVGTGVIHQVILKIFGNIFVFHFTYLKGDQGFLIYNMSNELCFDA